MNSYKLKRESMRLVNQTRALVRWPFEVLQKRRHDRDFHKLVHITLGDVPLNPKIAIFLIYQPKKLLTSTLLTCAHMKRNGYSVLLIANHPIKAEDHEALKAVTWQIVERPNFGYDFGGYRDGLRIIQESGAEPEAVVIMNDSVWWPLSQNDTALARMEQSGNDIMGMILRPPGKPRKRSRHRAPHLQSYFYWIKGSVLKAPAFNDFWSRYRMSSLKYNAIQRGELRFTAAMEKAELKVDALFIFDDLIAELRKRPTDYLVKVLDYAVYKHDDQKAKATALIAAATKDDAWREEVFALLQDKAKRGEFHVALHFACVDALGLNFLKRSSYEPKESQHHGARQKYIDAVTNKDLKDEVPEVLAEIVARHKSGAQAVGR